LVFLSVEGSSAAAAILRVIYVMQTSSLLSFTLLFRRISFTPCLTIEVVGRSVFTHPFQASVYIFNTHSFKLEDFYEYSFIPDYSKNINICGFLAFFNTSNCICLNVHGCIEFEVFCRN